MCGLIDSVFYKHHLGNFKKSEEKGLEAGERYRVFWGERAHGSGRVWENLNDRDSSTWWLIRSGDTEDLDMTAMWNSYWLLEKMIQTSRFHFVTKKLGLGAVRWLFKSRCLLIRPARLRRRSREPEFNPWDSDGRRRELTSKDVLWAPQAHGGVNISIDRCMHAQTDK